MNKRDMRAWHKKYKKRKQIYHLNYWWPRMLGLGVLVILGTIFFSMMISTVVYWAKV